MKILHLVYNLIRGGTEGQCARAAIWLSRNGINNRVAVFERHGFFLPEVEASCGNVYELPIRRSIGWTTWKEMQKFAAYVRREKFDLIHAWDADAAIYGANVAARCDIPLITSRRDMGEIYSSRKLKRMRKADQAASRIVVNAEAIKTKLVKERYDTKRIVVIPNFIDIQEFDVLHRQAVELACADDDVPIVMVARLDPEKDVITLLRALNELKKRKVLSFILYVAGDGIERTALEAYAKDRELPVVFLGDFTQVPALLKQCQIGVLVPKSNEGLSNTILEYMAAGLPVVASDCGGNPELVEHEKTGYVVPGSSAVPLAAALERLVRDAALRQRMGQCGRSRIEQKFDMDSVGSRFLKLYETVLNVPS